MSEGIPTIAFGVHRLSDAIINDNHTNDTVLLQTYGEYLMNGGKPEDFMRFTMDDVQIMFTVSQSERIKRTKTIVESIGKMFGAKEM